MAEQERPRDVVRVTLDERTVLRRSPEVEHERKIAIYDLLEENHFRPHGCGDGPYALHLSIQDNRLILEVRGEADDVRGRVPVPMLPFRKIVRQYFQICESYYDAIRHAPPSRIEAIDMGRRGLHDEGSEMLRQALDGKVELDHNTARRLFTLVCVLHIRG